MQRKIPTLLFNWELFVGGEAGDCIPSCVAMAARYWKNINLTSHISDNPQAWQDFVRKTSNVSYRGTSLKRLLVNLPSGDEVNNPTDKISKQMQDPEMESEDAPTLRAVEAQGLILDPRMLSEAKELIPFLRQKNAIPVILVLDVGLADRNKKWGQHAVLLHSIDIYQERKIHVIDPMLSSLKEPRPMDLRRFEIGWKECYNTAILVYPKGSDINIISLRQRNLELTEFMSEKSGL